MLDVHAITLTAANVAYEMLTAALQETPYEIVQMDYSGGVFSSSRDNMVGWRWKVLQDYLMDP